MNLISISKESDNFMTQRFFRHHCDSERIDFEIIVTSLILMSIKLRPAVWSQYKHALINHLFEQGLLDEADTLRSIANPVTSPNSPEIIRKRKPKARPSCHKVTEADHCKLMNYLIDKKDWSLCAAVIMAHLTGMRPAEMFNIQLVTDRLSMHITTAKKTEDGRRGIDRTLTFSEDDFALLHESYLYLVNEQHRDGLNPERAMKRLQNRLYDAVRKIWPRRKTHITLYSYRHQLGSNLKASGWDPITVSAIMGHQAVNSISTYGNAKSASRSPNIQVSEEARQGVRNTMLRITDFNALRSSEINERKTKVHRRIDASITTAKHSFNYTLV